MTPTPAELLAHRYRVPDSVLLDWLDLARLVEPPCLVTTADLIEHWSCSQPAVSRRLSRLWHARLLDYRTTRRGYHIRRIGPSVTDCNMPTALLHSRLYLGSIGRPSAPPTTTTSPGTGRFHSCLSTPSLAPLAASLAPSPVA